MINPPKYYGTKTYEQTLALLKETANKKTTMGYKQIFIIMGNKLGNYAVREAGYLLGEISERMHQQGKPMLSAIVINQDFKEPGKGFFQLAMDLGKLTAGASDAERTRFWEKEITAIYKMIW